MKRSVGRCFFLLLVLVMLLAAPLAAFAKGGGKTSFETGFMRWSALDNGFVDWTLAGVGIDESGALQFQEAGAVMETDPYLAGTYDGGNYYNGGSFFVGEAVSPVITTPFNYSEAIASWNASTPDGSWIEIQIRAQFGDTWSKWYSLGIWAEDYSTVSRHSVKSQADTDGTVYTDTFVVLKKKITTNKFQLKLRLFSVDGSVIASVRNASVAYSPPAPKSVTVSAGDPTRWNTLLDVPECSQMVYPDGGNVWCSPTSTSMVLGYWMDNPGSCADRVFAALDGVYDWIYDGYGNWPFNTAYAATKGLQAYVARFTSLDKVEEFVAVGYPVIISIAWNKGELTGAPIPSSAGHLMVVVGFDGFGNPIVNDPAAASDEEVQRTYLRSEFETLWLTNSGGTVYLIYPQVGSAPAIP